MVLLVTVDVPDGTKPPTTDFLGVDLGVINIAVDSDGQSTPRRRLRPNASSTLPGVERWQGDQEPGGASGGIAIRR